MQINKLLQTVIQQGAADLHLAVGRPPTIRLSGRLVPLPTKVLTDEDTISLMKSITSERCQQELQEVGSTDFGFGFGDIARFRVSVFKQRGHTGLVLRLIPNKLLTFEQIGLPPNIRKLLDRPRGLILVTGPTGSGKTTTLATMVDHINRGRDYHIITIEDPIEYQHKHIRSIITQREIGVDTPGFAEGLRRALRQDPDVILIGEMRDLETIETAIHAAETGHLVFGTLHTTGAAETVNRIIDQFPPAQQEQVRVMLSTTLLCVISQALIPKAAGKGVVAAFEIMIMTSAIQNLIRTKKTFQIDSEIQTGARHGMIALDESLLRLLASGLITQSEALSRARKPDDIQQKIDEGRLPVVEERPAADGKPKAPAQAKPGTQRPPAGAGRRPTLQINTASQKKR